MKVVVAAGGTGGHIYPALSIIEKIKKENKDCEVLYIGTTDRMEKDIVPERGIPFVGIEIKGLNRKNVFKNFSVVHKFLAAIKRVKKILKEFQPDIVIGVGGYITAPVLYAAHSLGIKTLIHEQNSIPGLSNKFLAKFVDTICVSLPGSMKYFPEQKTIYTGNPRSEEIVKIDKISKEEFGFSRHKKLVLIVMGSLGSTTMTKKLKDCVLSFKDKDYQVLLITGKAYYDDYASLDIPSNVKLLPFTEKLIQIMKDTDLMVSRAGASTISEITGIGLPSILVPSPYVTHNHQYLNAKELADAGACRILEEDKFSSDTLCQMIDEIFSNPIVYEEMKRASLSFGIHDSLSKIYREIEKLVGE